MTYYIDIESTLPGSTVMMHGIDITIQMSRKGGIKVVDSKTKVKIFNNNKDNQLWCLIEKCRMMRDKGNRIGKAKKLRVEAQRVYDSMPMGERFSFYKRFPEIVDVIKLPPPISLMEI